MTSVVGIDKPEISGQTGPFTLFLRTKAGALVNPGGNQLTEVTVALVKTGRWTTEVTQTITDDLVARIYEGTAENAAMILWSGWLPNGRLELQSEPPAAGTDPTTMLQVKAAVDSIAVALAGASPAPAAAPTVVDSLTQLRGLIQSSSGASILTTVRPGGKLVLKAGDDYVASELYTIDIPIDDASEAAYALLTRSQTAAIKFGASKAHATQTDQIAGTASKAAVYKNAGKTYVPVELLGSQLTNLIVGDNFRYDVQITSNAGRKRTVCSGLLVVEKDNAA